jgi:hypothetical protein
MRVGALSVQRREVPAEWRPEAGQILQPDRLAAFHLNAR